MVIGRCELRRSDILTLKYISWHASDLLDISSLISDWLNKAGMNFLEGVKQVGKHLILKGLGLEEFFSGRVCDRERKPYSPSVDGWNNGMLNCICNRKILN
jgi:hypothetical protein